MIPNSWSECRERVATSVGHKFSDQRRRESPSNTYENEVKMRAKSTSGRFDDLTFLSVLLAGALTICLPLVARSSSDWKGTLKDDLEKTYPLSHRAGLSPDRITQEGIVLVIEKQGIAADPSSDMRYSITYVQNGQIGEQGGAVAGIFNKTNSRVFKPGEKVYVTGIKIGDDYVMLELMSCDMFDVVKKGSTKQTRYKAALSFKFDPATLPTLDSAKIKAVISPIIATESEAQTANTKTVELGQTPDQVKAALGAPDKIVKLGPKEIYVYKDMKVVLTDGKVSDVQ